MHFPKSKGVKREVSDRIGAVTAEMAAANAAVGGVKAYRTAMGPMAARSADDKYLAKFFAKQGSISSLETS